VQGAGPFVRDSLSNGLLSLQTFMGFGALSPLVVAGAMSDRARLEREARKQAARRESRFRILSSASRAFVETNLQVPALFEAIARHIAEAIGDTCAIRISTEDDAHPELVALHRSPSGSAAARRDADALEATQDSSLVVVRSGSPLRIAEIDESSPGRASGGAWPIHSLLVAPLRSRESVVGSITLWREAPGNPYTVDDQNLLEELADRAGLALYNARLHEYLESAVQTRDDFLAIAGHELKTPLAALIMQLQSIQRALERNPGKVPERVERATKSGFRLERLINQLLDVSRIRAGKLRLEAESVRLDELVKDVVARFVEASAKPEPAISVRCEEAVEGHWDRFRIDQVVDNLVGNAVKYGQGKPVEVDLRVEDGAALLRVVDHGIGIRPEHQKKIFQRFERATGTRDFGGLGLGLWISSQIVEASGGTIEVESEAGSGSTFTVRLPLQPPG
jgi:signal transduction histidine kinase